MHSTKRLIPFIVIVAILSSISLLPALAYEADAPRGPLYHHDRPVQQKPIIDENGEVFYFDLDWVKENLNKWYTDEEIRQTGCIVQAEDIIANSDTIWSAHVWCILDRVGAPGFSGNDSIIGILSAPRQFDTYTSSNLSKAVDPSIDWIVRDVFARKVLENYGAPSEVVGRTLPPEYHYFRAGGGIYNRFWTSWAGGAEYDPFSAPHNPYSN